MVNGVVEWLNTPLCMRCHALPLQNEQESKAATTEDVATINHCNMTAIIMWRVFLMLRVDTMNKTCSYEE